MKLILILLFSELFSPAIFAADSSDEALIKRAAEQLYNAYNAKDESAKSSLSRQDQKAYEALRQRGNSPDEAKEAAPYVRKFCQATGGNDCQ